MHMDSFRASRWIRTINLVLQAILFASFFGGLNYLSTHYSLRFDLTRSKKYSLSEETLSYLKGLPREVRVTITLSSDMADADTFEDIRSLLREYTFASQPNGAGRSVKVEYIDIYQRPRDASERGLDEEAVYFECGDKRRKVRHDELYRIENRVKKAFLGEQVFTAAILDVSAPEQKKIYFLTGHGELRLDDSDRMRGLSSLGGQLKVRNFAVETLDINATRRVPEDAALVVVAAPDRVEPFVQEQLRRYLSDNAGRVILLLSTRMQHGLDELLEDWGIWAHDVVLCDSNPDSITEEQDLTIRSFAANHPITQTLIERKLLLRLGETRCINPLPSKIRGSGLNITTLAVTTSTAWGERNYRGPRPYVYNEGLDLRGSAASIPEHCLGVAVASEPVQAGGNLPFSVKGGRLVVFGTADMIVNDRFTGTPGNQNIFLNAINWAVERDTQLATPARAIERFQIALSLEELSRLRLLLWFGLPALAGGLGLIVYWTRRH